ncbi:hypothetical protein ACE4Z5_25040, partial [Salmonella enterica]|uniref:hypothetical protein n=1 Tax=Salmonella enterica TaxID=28901 RepID=UPI003D27010D
DLYKAWTTDEVIVFHRDTRVEVAKTTARPEVEKLFAADKLLIESVPVFAEMGEMTQAVDTRAVTLHSRIRSRFHTVDAEGNKIVQKVTATPGR